MIEPTIITETEDYLVIDKPWQMATEPPSHMPTLRDWLIENGYVDKKDWEQKHRYGVIHRLDTDTSGVIIWAKNKDAQERLRKLWQGRAVEKNYLALTYGNISKSGSIEYPIMRDNKKDKQTVAVFPHPKARPAITEYERLSSKTFDGTAINLVKAKPITGRTHQIRVHLKSIGNPIIGDKLYGDKHSKRIANKLKVNRQLLHASSIIIDSQEYRAELPNDILNVLKTLKIELDDKLNVN